MANQLPICVKNGLKDNIVKDIIGMVEKYTVFHINKTEIYKFYKKNILKNKKKNIELKSFDNSILNMDNKHYEYAFKKGIYNVHEIAEIAKLLQTYYFEKIFMENYGEGHAIMANLDIYNCIILLRMASLTTYVPYYAYDILFQIANKTKSEKFYYSCYEYVKFSDIETIIDYLNIGIYNLDQIISKYCDYKLNRHIKNHKYIKIMDIFKFNTIENVIKQNGYDNPNNVDQDNLKLLLICEYQHNKPSNKFGTLTTKVTGDSSRNIIKSFEI